jgi:hypothetical protein
LASVWPLQNPTCPDESLRSLRESLPTVCLHLKGVLAAHPLCSSTKPLAAHTTSLCGGRGGTLGDADFPTSFFCLDTFVLLREAWLAQPVQPAHIWTRVAHLHLRRLYQQPHRRKPKCRSRWPGGARSGACPGTRRLAPRQSLWQLQLSSRVEPKVSSATKDDRPPNVIFGHPEMQKSEIPRMTIPRMSTYVHLCPLVSTNALFGLICEIPTMSTCVHLCPQCPFLGKSVKSQLCPQCPFLGKCEIPTMSTFAPPLSSPVAKPTSQEPLEEALRRRQPPRS